MLRKIRIALSTVMLLAAMVLFLDFTGTVHAYLGWIAKIQLLPAILALNFGVIAVLAVLTLVFGRIYCSVICPLGILQDIIGWLGRRGKKNKLKYSWSKEKLLLRFILLGVTFGSIGAGLMFVPALLEPYSAFGRIAQSLLAPVYAWGNNFLAYLAERADSYAFYTTDVWIKGGVTLGIAIATLIALSILAWRNGRTWCNTICPVGSLLSFLSRYAMFRPVIDTKKCKDCKLCERSCKASCIHIEEHKIDHSRCVVCFDCIDTCKFGALKYKYAWNKEISPGGPPAPGRNDKSNPEGPELARYNPGTPGDDTAAVQSADAPVIPSEAKESPDTGRRAFLVGTALAVGSVALRAQKDRANSALAAVEGQGGHSQPGETGDDTADKKFDGGLATIKEKKRFVRGIPLVPPGAGGLKRFSQHCTACQLCVSVCPNGVLHPSTKFDRFMQPESSYERGYCRPECTRCSQVCPSGAIRKITVEEKTAIQIGYAVWIQENCLAAKGRRCDNCAHHCPTGAIQMVEMDINGKKRKVPVVNEAKCIGCGACENLCPASPYSGMCVEGYMIHNEI